jgi:hypothetical protein
LSTEGPSNRQQAQRLITIAFVSENVESAGTVQRWQLRLIHFVLGAGIFFLGILVGRTVAPAGPVFDMNSQLFRDFLTSAGFGGLAALGAATVAYAATSHGVEAVRRENDKDRSERQRLHDDDVEQSNNDRERRETKDEREVQWARLVWAADLAVEPKTSELGLLVISELLDGDWVDPVDNVVADAIAVAVETSNDESSASAGASKENDR